jgi:signal peptidase I
LDAEPLTEEPTAREPGENVKPIRIILDVLETVLLAVALYIGINALTARVRVEGFSMLPTLQDGELLLVNRLAYRFDTPQYGDIIVFHYPGQPPQDLVKRVIGLPGDHISVASGVVSVNGLPLNEPYIAAAPNYTGEWDVKEGFLFVLGDNRNDSSDSHAWGLLPMENVIGKGLVIYWPPKEWKAINHIPIMTPAP